MTDPDLKRCERRGCSEIAIGFNDDGEHLCEDCLFEDQIELPPEDEDDHE